MITKDLTKDEITQSALRELRANGARVRKVHNVSAYKKRRGQVEPGWPDIQGYSSMGVAILCEVKTLRDKLSSDQIAILNDLDYRGGISLIAIQKGLQVKVMTWKDYCANH
jgi:hypothetical protein